MIGLSLDDVEISNLNKIVEDRSCCRVYCTGCPLNGIAKQLGFSAGCTEMGHKLFGYKSLTDASISVICDYLKENMLSFWMVK
ncbi:MAG: hypothetical protein ACRDDH_14690 [Cetobacterium sp.]|uniref:hypothetical protein n=1 Tax=Cetobacterium sp. TaxID=2071632 RepID=UPI003EE588A1